MRSTDHSQSASMFFAMKVNSFVNTLGVHTLGMHASCGRRTTHSASRQSESADSVKWADEVPVAESESSSIESSSVHDVDTVYT